MLTYMNCCPDDWITLENGTRIHRTAQVYPHVFFGEHCIIGEYVIIGRENLSLLSAGDELKGAAGTYIGEHTTIDAHSFISQGAKIAEHAVLSRNTFIGRYVSIGAYTKCHYNAQIFQNVVIGHHCRIGGFCCNDSVVGDYANVYGTLGHRFKQRNAPEKKAPIIGSHATVGTGSIVLEGVTIGEGAYIAANAVVTKDVGAYQRVRLINEVF